MGKEDIKIIEGEIHCDYRGSISSLNAFHFEDIRRAYFIHHPDASVIRGWHAHQHERKWFYCVKGAFTLAFVRIDNWECPSSDLKAEIIKVSDTDSKIVCVPEGYANCLKASVPDSVLMVLSDKILEDAIGDSWRYDNSMWVDWKNI